MLIPRWLNYIQNAFVIKDITFELYGADVLLLPDCSLIERLKL